MSTNSDCSSQPYEAWNVDCRLVEPQHDIFPSNVSECSIYYFSQKHTGFKEGGVAALTVLELLPGFWSCNLVAFFENIFQLKNIFWEETPVKISDG